MDENQFIDTLAANVHRRYGIPKDEAKQAVINMILAAPSRYALLSNHNPKELADMAYHDFRD